MLTPSEVEWLKQDSSRARELYLRMAENDPRLNALIESEASV